MGLPRPRFALKLPGDREAEAMQQNDTNFFRPMWRRVAVVVFLTGWLAWEAFYTREQMWMLIVGAVLAYAIWSFFITFDRPSKSGGDDSKPGA